MAGSGLEGSIDDASVLIAGESLGEVGTTDTDGCGGDGAVRQVKLTHMSTDLQA